MAISNLTKTAVLFVFSFFRRTYGNISSSFHRNNFQQILLSPENARALTMLNKSYFFRYRDDSFNRLHPLGVMRVVSVVVNCSDGPEIAISSSSDDMVDFFPLSQLLVLHEVLRVN